MNISLLNIKKQYNILLRFVFKKTDIFREVFSFFSQNPGVTMKNSAKKS